MQTYFPTLDDLIIACGQHLLESLRLPPPDRAAEIFEGAASEHERMERLVGTIFGAYEREGRAWRPAGANGANCPCLTNRWSSWTWRSTRSSPSRCRHGELTPTSVTTLRALSDVTIWRALRDQGASPAASVQQASTAIERWLEARRPAHA